MVHGCCKLFVRNQSCNIFLVNIGHHGSVAQVALTLAGLACQDVAGKCIAPLDAPCAGFLEALGCAPIGLDFRHIDIFSFVENEPCI